MENGVVLMWKRVRGTCYMMPGMKRFEEGTRTSFFEKEEEGKTTVQSMP